MTTRNDDGYWDELGVAWRAITPEVTRLTASLKAQAHRQSRTATAVFVIGVPLTLGGVALGVFTIWSGWTSGAWNFVTRGIAVAMISVLLLRAIISVRPFKAPVETSALPQLLDALIARSRQTLATLRAGVAACAIAAIFGLAGVVIRTRAGSGLELSPIVDLLLLALIAALLWSYVGRVQTTRQKLEHLRRTLVPGNDESAP